MYGIGIYYVYIQIQQRIYVFVKNSIHPFGVIVKSIQNAIILIKPANTLKSNNNNKKNPFLDFSYATYILSYDICSYLNREKAYNFTISLYYIMVFHLVLTRHNTYFSCHYNFQLNFCKST